jgi:hypothetical protein
MLNSLALRGRSLFTLSSPSTLPLSLRPLADAAITSAHQILIIVLEEPTIRDSMVGVPLYLHTVIAFAVVFLIKMSSRWQGIGVSIDAEMKTRPLVEGVIALFRSCRAGKGHILYAMADGFERLLRRNMNGKAENGYVAGSGGLASLGAAAELRSNSAARPYTPTNQDFSSASQPGPTLFASSSQTNTPNLLHPTTSSPTPYPPNGASGTPFDPYTALSPHSQPTSAGTYGGWQTEDDMLWSMGMGYDLLATAPDVNAHGLGAFVGYGGSLDGGGGTGGGGGGGGYSGL